MFSMQDDSALQSDRNDSKYDWQPPSSRPVPPDPPGSHSC